MFWDSINPLLAGEKPAYRLYRSIPARMYGVWRPENEQISWAALLWNTIRLLKYQAKLWLVCVGCSFTRFPGDLKPPMDSYLHVSGHVVNQNPVNMAAWGLKAKISSDVLGPTITSEAIVVKKISWGSISLLLCMHTIMFALRYLYQ